MSDETFRQEPDPYKQPDNPDRPMISGPIPAGLRQAMRAVQQEAVQTQARVQGSATLEGLIAGLVPDQFGIYGECLLPSKGRFYNGEDGPTDGVLHMRPMTGEEELILAQPRYVKSGQAIPMILNRCLEERHYKTENFLTIDKNFLLIWLRGISYSHEYEAEITCEECDRKFVKTLNLDCPKKLCPENFGPDSLSGKLPKSGYRFSYRLPRGYDDTKLQHYRNDKINKWGENSTDDSSLYRTAMLTMEIEGLKDKQEIVMLLKKMNIQDVAYLRYLINNPPFGIDTKYQIECPMCFHEFEVELPYESNFFFPQPKMEEKDQQA